MYIDQKSRAVEMLFDLLSTFIESPRFFPLALVKSNARL